jgi:DnaD/phage-associated family protein
MNKRIASTLSGFTPAPDVLIKEYSFVTALVWGRIWRYCQGRDGICRAKLETIAGELGMSMRTIIRHIEPLVEDGYLLDTTPDLRNKPHIYADTFKIRIRVSVEATVTESHTAVTESHRHSDRESLEESIKKELKKESTTATERPKTFVAYEENIGAITQHIADCVQDAEKIYPESWIIETFQIAAENNKRNWRYCETILKRWQREGKDDGKKPAQTQGVSYAKRNPTHPKHTEPSAEQDEASRKLGAQIRAERAAARV